MLTLFFIIITDFSYILRSLIRDASVEIFILSDTFVNVIAKNLKRFKTFLLSLHYEF